MTPQSIALKALVALCAVVTTYMSLADTARAASRIKDLVKIEGVRENQLVGYGLVVGLKGTGDTLNNSPFTKQSLEAMLERLGVNTRGNKMRTANVAAVMVSTNLPPFSAQGTRIDINVSALGDATSLQGGTLLVTPLMGADGNVYAVGQGPVAVGGFTAEGDAAKITRGVPTAGRISNGALVEREIKYKFAGKTEVRLSLHNPDFTTSQRIVDAINSFIGMAAARQVDPATIILKLPASLKKSFVGLLTEIEKLLVEPDQRAKVVIDEKTGIIVMGNHVRVSTVAIAQGSLTVTISETPEVVQPGPLAPRGARTVVVPRSRVDVDDEKEHKLTVLKNSITLQQLVDGLNALGIGPRDMISILQSIKAVGALQAEILVM